jgi:tRNA (mo5U34)-methyltransferase
MRRRRILGVVSAPVSAQAGTEDRLREALEDTWYHSIEVAPGAVTSGWVDLRHVAPRVLPDLSGLRALDVGTFDGFWAFAMERAGAAEVVATDVGSVTELEIPPVQRAGVLREIDGLDLGRRFALAAELLESRVRRVESGIYDIDAARLGGPFDYAVVGDLLLHLRDPIRGLEAVRRALRPAGRLLLVEQINVMLTVMHPRTPCARMSATETRFDWWQANACCLRAWLAAAGFERPHRRRFYRVRPADERTGRWHVALEARPGALDSGP